MTYIAEPSPRDCPRCAADDFMTIALGPDGKGGEAHCCRACGWPGAERNFIGVESPITKPVLEAQS